MTDDFTIEDNVEDMGDMGAAQAKIKKLREQLAEAQQKRDEYLDGWQRCKADMVNTKQEYARQAQRSSERAVDTLIEDLIPALDGFDMAASSSVWESVSPEWRSGIELIRGQIMDALARNGYKRFGAVGDAIDHRLHEVVQEDENAAGEPNTISRVLRFGYQKDDRIIRPAQVIAKQ